MTRLSSWLLLSFGAVDAPALSASSGTVPFVLDGNRVYAQVEFMTADGKSRKALVFVDLGSPSMILSYWERQSALDPHDLDYVGLTLLSRHGEYYVGGIAARDGRPTVTGVQVGDKLIQIGTLATQGASREAIFEAMHGKAAQARLLILERAGNRFEVRTRVTAF